MYVLQFCDFRSRAARNLALDCRFLVLFWGSDSPEIGKSLKMLLFKAKKVTLREGFSGFQRILVKKGAGTF